MSTCLLPSPSTSPPRYRLVKCLPLLGKLKLRFSFSVDAFAGNNLLSVAGIAIEDVVSAKMVLDRYVNCPTMTNG